jgi:hypothetical protein
MFHKIIVQKFEENSILETWIKKEVKVKVKVKISLLQAMEAHRVARG